MINPGVRILQAIAAACLLGGCGTMPNSYIPRTLGSLQNAERTDDLHVSMAPGSEIAYRGEPIVFHLTLRNTGSRTFWIPRRPDVLLTWTYPNGVHDNFIRDFQEARFFQRDEAVRLEPGGELTIDIPVRTYYFTMNGITEFRAVVHSSRNTNPALAPFWHGRILSNAFGVLVQGPRKKSAMRASSPASAAPLSSS